MNRMLRLALYLVLGLLLGANAALSHAAYSSIKSTNYKTAGGSTGWTGASGTVSNGTVNTIETINIGGKYISVPAFGPVSATAAEVLIMAIQRSPQAIVVGSVVSYLARAGLELLDGQLVKRSLSSGVPQSVLNSCDGMPIYTGAGGTFCNNLAAAACPGDTGIWMAGATSATAGTATCYPSMNPGPYTKCFTTGQYACVPQTETRTPATDADFAPLRGVRPDDAVLNETATKVGPYPLTSLTPTTVFEPLSDWRTIPGTSDKERDVVRITPAPTTDDPLRVQVSPEKQTWTGGQPEPTTTSPTTKDTNPDFCTLHPEAIACWEKGDPPEIELEEKSIPIAITPEGGFGADDAACPAPERTTLRNGTVVEMSYEPVCKTARAFRPVIIAFAWLTAVLIFLGLSRKVQ